MKNKVSISVVSHHQADLVNYLLEDIYCVVDQELIEEIIITINEPESFSFDCLTLPIRVVENTSAKGFAENHNNAFKISTGNFFCVLNPDIRMKQDPFPQLLSTCESQQGITAPEVLNTREEVEDSLRKFPTLLNLSLRLLGRRANTAIDDKSDRKVVDWAGGMFLLFSRESFQAVSGFDEKFFLYYEDVDICARMWKANRPVIACTNVRVFHDAQRRSHRSFQYFKWHMFSMFRYFIKHWSRLPKTFVSNELN